MVTCWPCGGKSGPHLLASCRCWCCDSTNLRRPSTCCSNHSHRLSIMDSRGCSSLLLGFDISTLGSPNHLFQLPSLTNSYSERSTDAGCISERRGCIPGIGGRHGKSHGPSCGGGKLGTCVPPGVVRFSSSEEVVSWGYSLVVVVVVVVSHDHHGLPGILRTTNALY